MVKFPNVNDIAWGKIREVRVSNGPGKGAYSFEFDLNGRKQKMTIAIDGNTTSYTLSTEDGSPLLHGIQNGREFRVIDFSSKPSLKGANRLKKFWKMRKN